MVASRCIKLLTKLQQVMIEISQKPKKFARIKFRESLYRQMKHFANLQKICEIAKFNSHESLFS